MARPAHRPGNLPAGVSSLVGRQRELAEVRKKLAEARLVSLVGTGGVGKSCLAVRAASDLGRGFRDGAWLAELAEVVDPALAASAVMTTLGLRDRGAADPMSLLLSYLRDKQLLLVTDNCEHLLAAAARLVTEILKAAPGVRVIATSREPLSAPGEHVVRVPPLPLPPPAGPPLPQLRQNPAVLLFTQRAAAASGTFELTTANQAAVAELCRRLDGLPLAIELAAVRTRVLTAEQILERLTDRFALLTGGARGAAPRHQTLRTAIEWSHDLLPGGERALLRRCCVFAGRFTLEDAESVCAAGPTLDLLSSLVGKSLVMKDDVKGQAWYRLHETMREFAALKLAEAGEQKDAQARCAGYYLSRCQQPSPGEEPGEEGLADWLEWVDLEIDNIRAVLRGCLVRGDADVGIGIAQSLAWYWMTRATTEGMRWLDEFLACGGVDPQARGWGLFLRGFLAVLKADPAAARSALHEAVGAARHGGQKELLTHALSMGSIAENMAGDRASGRRMLDEAQLVSAGLGFLPGTLAVLQARALMGFFESDLDAVRSAAREGVRLAREAGDLYRLEVMLLNLGTVGLLAGDLDGARPLLTEALEIARRLDDRNAQLYLFDAFGWHAALSGQPRLAARLMGAADEARRQTGAHVMPFAAPSLTKVRQSLTATLGTARFETEFEAGQRLGWEAAAVALGEPGHDGGTGDGQARQAVGDGPLGKREADVARLVADGLTNKQIAARLFVSERTVDSHVRNILNKLGFGSRAQIAAWIASPDR